MITRVRLKNVTVFRSADMAFSNGVNIFIGENGTGKTHLMKVLYSACSIVDQKEERTLDQKLKAVFLPNSIGRLVHRSQGRGACELTVYKSIEGKDSSISCKISTLNKVEIKDKTWKSQTPFESIFIPVKDMLANAPGFRSLVSQKKIFFEEVYQDIIDKAFMPISKGRLTGESSKLLDILSGAISGKVIEKNEMFYLKNKNGELEFTLLAEGYRKLGLLYKLIQNETLANGTVLFWDEPEANLNPKLLNVVVKILLALQRMGVQIFISTHNYVLLKEFALESSVEDNVMYHVLFHDSEDIKHFSTANFDELTPNAIDDVYAGLMDREIQKGIDLL